MRWLYGVARQVIRQAWRSNERRGRLVERARGAAVAVDRDPLTEVIEREDQRLAVQAAARLQQSDREIILMALWMELSHTQIAATLGCTELASRQRLVRARHRLIRQFEEIAGNPSDARSPGAATT